MTKSYGLLSPNFELLPKNVAELLQTWNMYTNLQICLNQFYLTLLIFI